MVRSIFILLFIFILPFHYSLEADEDERCKENKKVAAMFLKQIEDISNIPDPTIEDTKKLCRPMEEGFGLNWGQCSGFTEQVRQAAKKVLRQRAKKVVKNLIELCSQSIPDTNDINLVVAIMEEREAAKKALEHIDIQINQCSE